MMASMTSDSEWLSPELQRLLQLFSSLPDVRFPELDTGSLQDAVAHLKEQHLAACELEATLQAARLTLDEAQEGLLRRGHRLLGYLKLYAEGDEVLAQKVASISLPRARRAVPESGAAVADAPRKRGRPRKVPVSDALFAERLDAVAAAS